MRKLFLFLNFMVFFKVGFSQTKTIYNLYSDYQMERVPSGDIHYEHHPANIYIVDPMPATNEKDDIDYRPEGDIIVKYLELKEPMNYGIKYICKTNFDSKKQNFYGITRTTDNIEGVIFIKEKKMVNNKMYNYIILMGNYDGGYAIKPTTFIMYYCNLISAKPH